MDLDITGVHSFLHKITFSQVSLVLTTEWIGLLFLEWGPSIIARGLQSLCFP